MMVSQVGNPEFSNAVARLVLTSSWLDRRHSDDEHDSRHAPARAAEPVTGSSVCVCLLCVPLQRDAIGNAAAVELDIVPTFEQRTNDRRSVSVLDALRDGEEGVVDEEAVEEVAERGRDAVPQRVRVKDAPHGREVVHLQRRGGHQACRRMRSTGAQAAQHTRQET